MAGKVIYHIVNTAGHGAPGCLYMAAAAEISRNFRHIQCCVGPHAYLEDLRFHLVQEKGTVDSLSNPQLLHDPIQILAVTP